MASSVIVAGSPVAMLAVKPPDPAVTFQEPPVMVVRPRRCQVPATSSASPAAAAVIVPFGVSRVAVAENRSTPIDDGRSVPRLIVTVTAADEMTAAMPFDTTLAPGALVT